MDERRQAAARPLKAERERHLAQLSVPRVPTSEEARRRYAEASREFEGAQQWAALMTRDQEVP